MNESIKFIADSKSGKYAENDTGVMVGSVYTPYAGVLAIVRHEDGIYVEAPLSDIEYAAAES